MRSLSLRTGALPVLLAGATAAAGADEPLLVTPYEDSPCWVTIYDGKQFEPPGARLEGPTFLEEPETGPVVTLDLRDVGGQDFIDRIDSLIVGPRARITVYAEPTYSGDRVSFGPGEKVPDLAAHNFANRIRSIKVQCD